MSKIIELKGKTFGRLRVLEKAPPTGGQAEWICKCQCGNIKKVKGQHLRSGAIKSCGCYMRERVSSTKTVNLLGKKFGRLQVMRYDSSENGRAKWLCKCDCGKEISVFSSYLQTGDTQSCGCLISNKEEYIEKLLINSGAIYVRQYTFPDLRGRKYPLRFDFAIFTNTSELKCLIEYQGAAHYYNVFKVSEQEYQLALKRDELKRKYCEEHNIKLYEFNKSTDIESELKVILNDN